jgi:hypothetical protein
MAQTNRAFLQNLRDLVTGKRPKGTPIEVPSRRITPNQMMAGTAAAYGADPATGRKPLLEFLRWQLEVSFWSRAKSEELGTGSHCAIWYGGQDAALLFAMREEDREVFDTVLQVERACMALESLCSTPAGEVVMPGARCWVSDSSTPPGQADADQRKIRDRRRAFLLGKRMSLPNGIETALDWTGLWVLNEIETARKKRETWAKDWLQTRQQIAGATPEDLPPSRNHLTVEKSAHGHRAYFANCIGMLRPCYWATVDYSSPEPPQYGCDPSWRKNQPGDKLPANLPMPELPGGNLIKRYDLTARRPEL